METKVTELRKAYPELAPDKDYPPLRFKSLKGKVSAAEWEARLDCACAYRLVRLFGMDDLIYNHISARIPRTEEFLLNPFGMMYDEICASSLIKVDLSGKLLWEPDLPKGLGYKFNPAGYVIHSAIHEAKPELHCVIHTHSLAGMAVASLVKGLLRGYRGLPKGDLDALARAVAAFSRLALVAGRPVREAEANPVLVRDNGVVAVDALVVLKEA